MQNTNLKLGLGFILISYWFQCSASSNFRNNDAETEQVQNKREYISENATNKRIKTDINLLQPVLEKEAEPIQTRNQLQDCESTFFNRMMQALPSSSAQETSTQLINLSTSEFNKIKYSTTIEQIPTESWRQIISYLTSITKLHHVSRYFFTLLTDYSPDHIQQRGFTNQFMLPHPSRLQIQGYQVDFDRIKEIGNYDIEAIPSYIWYSLTGTAINMPPSHYNHLIGTWIHTLSCSHGCTYSKIYALSCTLQQTVILTLKLRSENPVHRRITVKGAQALTGLINLTSLDIEINFIGDVGASSIATLTNLAFLDIGSNDIEDAGASALAVLTNLTSLKIAGNNIGEVGARALTALTKLTSLDIRSNNVGDAGARALAALTNLTSLNMQNNNIGKAVQSELRHDLNHMHISF